MKSLIAFNVPDLQDYCTRAKLIYSGYDIKVETICPRLVVKDPFEDKEMRERFVSRIKLSNRWPPRSVSAEVGQVLYGMNGHRGSIYIELFGEGFDAALAELNSEFESGPADRHSRVSLVSKIKDPAVSRVYDSFLGVTRPKKVMLDALTLYDEIDGNWKMADLMQAVPA